MALGEVRAPDVDDEGRAAEEDDQHDGQENKDLTAFVVPPQERPHCRHLRSGSRSWAFWVELLTRRTVGGDAALGSPR